MVWRMSPYERRRGGNALPGGLRGRPGADNARAGQRGSGHSAAMAVGSRPDAEPDSAVLTSWRRGDANSTMAGRRVRQHRSFASWGKARPEKYRESRGQNRTREIRPSGIVEGLQETWPVGAGLHAARAPDFYLDRTSLPLRELRDSLLTQLLRTGFSLSPRRYAAIVRAVPSSRVQRRQSTSAADACPDFAHQSSSSP
jgi:hypothetical protein